MGVVMKLLTKVTKVSRSPRHRKQKNGERGKDARGKDAARRASERDLRESRLGVWMWQHGIHRELVRGKDRGVHHCDTKLRCKGDSARYALGCPAAGGKGSYHRRRLLVNERR